MGNPGPPAGLVTLPGTMIRLFLILSMVLTSLMAQNMTQPAVKRFFKYTDAAGLKTVGF